MLPVVAIVGRPNVGKSTLFNRLAGKRLAIVHDAPGVTRDRHYADAHLQGRDLTLVDTGGFDPGAEDTMRQGIARQVLAAIEEADVVLCVLDGQGAATSADQQAVQLLRRSSKPVLFAANKADNPRLTHAAHELFELGVDGICFVSALHGRGMAELEQALVRLLPEERPPIPEVESGDQPARVALIGRPNAGKSSLLNYISGCERSLVDAAPGTTRDPVDADLTYAGRRYRVIDTAGVRRRSRIKEPVEAASVIRALRAIGRADVAVLLCDAGEGIAEQDARLLGLCADRGTAVIVGMNKTDLLRPEQQKKALENARVQLHFAPWAKLMPLSAKLGTGVDALMAAVTQASSEFRRRIPTAELNRFFRDVLERQPPPTQGRSAPRMFFITQAETSPPIFVVMASQSAHVRESYRTFVANQIRERFGFSYVPVRVKFKERQRRELPGRPERS